VADQLPEHSPLDDRHRPVPELCDAEAETMYTESWRAFVRDKYDADPSVTYFDSPVVVDNLSHEILSDD
jgi:hypothetical protein